MGQNVVMLKLGGAALALPPGPRDPVHVSPIFSCAAGYVVSLTREREYRRIERTDRRLLEASSTMEM